MIKSRHESIHLAFQYIYYEYEMGNGEWRDCRGSWIHYQLQKAAFLKQGRRKGPTPQVFIYTTHNIQHTMHGIVNSCSPPTPPMYSVVWCLCHALCVPFILHFIWVWWMFNTDKQEQELSGCLLFSHCSVQDSVKCQHSSCQKGFFKQKKKVFLSVRKTSAPCLHWTSQGKPSLGYWFHAWIWVC